MARVIAIPLLFMTLIMLGRGAMWILGFAASPAAQEAVAESAWGQSSARGTVAQSSDGRWVRTRESAQAQEKVINQNLVNGDPMMSGEPIGEAQEYTTTVNGVRETHRRQETGLVSRMDDGGEKRFGDPGYTGP